MRQIELVGKLFSQFVALGDEAFMNSQKCIFAAHVNSLLPTSPVVVTCCGPVVWAMKNSPNWPCGLC
jgi:hypothetical protein